VAVVVALLLVVLVVLVLAPAARLRLLFADALLLSSASTQDDKPANFYDELLEGDDVAVASVRDAVPQGRPASEPLPGERACVPGAWTASGELLMACPAFDLAASEALLGGAEGGWAGEGEAEFWAAVEAALA